MKSMMKWRFILIPAVLLGLILFNMIGVHIGGTSGLSLQQGGQFGHHGGGHHFERGARSYGSIYGQASFFIPVLLLVVFKAGLALAGWMIWRVSKGKGGKIAGAVLLSAGVFSLLPKVIGVPFLILMAYLGYKFFQKINEEELEFVPAAELAGSYQIENQMKTRDFLDEWENSIRREDK